MNVVEVRSMWVCVSGNMYVWPFHLDCIILDSHFYRL